MKQLMATSLAALGLFSAGCLNAASAWAELPIISVTLGATYPVVDEGTLASSNTLETVSGSKITCSDRTDQLTVIERTSLATYHEDLTGCKEGSNPCKTSGDPKETILRTGEEHLVFLPGGGKGTLELPSAYVTECGEPGKTKIKVKRDILGEVIAAANTEITSYKVVLTGKGGKQNLTTYLNSSGMEVGGVFLEANFGLGYEQADENVEGELTLKVTEGKMIEIT
jgi:hypothetical protein